jgi:tetratricopeptide (TPR) repeat protein
MSDVNNFPRTPPPYPALPQQQNAGRPMQGQGREDANMGINDLEPFIVTLEKMGSPDLAAEVLKAFEKNSQSFFQYENISKCYFKLKQWYDAMRTGEKAIALSPNEEFTDVLRSNLINIYNRANYPEKAMAYIKIQERKVATGVNLALDKAYTLYLLERKPEAKQILEDALFNHADELDDETKIKIRFNLGTYYLYEDQFQKGLRHFMLEGAKMKLWQAEALQERNKKLGFTFWEGSPDCKNLIVYGEAGIGDEVINSRFMKHLKDRGINAYWYTATQSDRDKNDRVGLTQILKKNNIPVIEDLAEIKKLGLTDVYWTLSMRLPIYLNCEYKDLWYGPYLKPCSEFKKKWKLKGKKLKIGIRWRGSKHYEHDLHRSYPLKELYQIVKDIDADFYSLQKHDGVEELPDFPGIINVEDKLETLEDTFALISNLDLVITSCTSIAHLAASQGKEVIVMTPISAYYLWCQIGPKTHWYGDNVTLVKQKKPRGWGEAMLELKEVLSKRGFYK